jgi:hypothetical protein
MEMELVELKLDLPDIFYDIGSKMSNIKNKNAFWCIAGGALSNLYMNVPIRDIDVFITYDIKEDELSKLFGTDFKVLEKRAGYRGWDSIPYLYKTRYKDYEIEFIICDKNRIFDFDIRFRQFYFYDNKVFVNKHALTDIKNKEIVVTSPYSPFSTYVRCKYFEETLGFTLSKKSFNFLVWSMNEMRKSVDSVVEYIENHEKISPLAKSEIIELFKSNTKDEYRENIYFKDVIFPFEPSIDDTIDRHLCDTENIQPLLSFYYDELDVFKPVDKVFPLTLSWDDFRPQVEKLIKRLKSFRLDSVFDVNAPNIPIFNTHELEKRWVEYFQNDLNSCFENIEGFHLYFKAPLFENGQVNVKIKTHLGIDFSLGDILNNNILDVYLNDNLYFYARKTDSGKYTLSGITKSSFWMGSGFYFYMIGHALKKQYPDIFEFDNPDVSVVYSYSTLRSPEHFFQKPKFPFYLEHLEKVKLSKIIKK